MRSFIKTVYHYFYFPACYICVIQIPCILRCVRRSVYGPKTSWEAHFQVVLESSSHLRNEKLMKWFSSNKALLWGVYGPCGIPRLLPLPLLRLHSRWFWKLLWSGSCGCTRLFDWGLESTKTFVPKSPHGCRQPSALCKTMKPSLWRLSAYCSTSLPCAAR